ncbi:hypothetical protein, partial [Candidatus Borrarchaeum sp.]|uniref:hypothetical protein n=1 Tax=Candidatus Borrarchaeum sp. TaxID=2846742 RepID=UPI00257BBA71
TKRPSVQTEPRSMQNLCSVMAEVWCFIVCRSPSTIRKGVSPFIFLGEPNDSVIITNNVVGFIKKEICVFIKKNYRSKQH